jgi:hypothetical protein
MSNQDITDVVEAAELSQYVVLGEALANLERNKDFQTLILNGYMRDKVLESVSLLGHHDIKKQGLRPEVMEDLVASSNLGEYFRMVKNFHAGALADYEELDAELDAEA